MALANAGFVHEQPAVVSYAAPAPSSSSYTKTFAYTEPKAYVHHEPVYHHQPVYQHQQVYQHQPAVHYAPSAHYGHYEHGHSEQNIVRTPHGTVSQISKHVDTPHSSVRKYDTRITNDGYKTVQYAHQPAYYHQPAVHYASHPQVIEKHVVAAPAVVHKTISQPIVAAPVVHKTYAQPAIYAQKAYVHEPVHHHVAHAPVIAQKAIHYSPAIEVSHASFESPVVHYSW